MNKNLEISRVIKRFDQVFDDLLECIGTVISETNNFTEDDYRSLADTLSKRGQTIIYSNTSLYTRNFQDIDLILSRVSKYLKD